MKDESSVLLLKRFQCDSGASGLAAASQSDGTLLGPSTADDVPPAVMLRLLTHCYARGVYASGDIERKLRKSPTRQAVPDAKAIQRFRRYHRAALQKALERTLQLMHHSAANEEPPTGIRREAAEKLEMAAISDNSLEE